MKSVLSFGNVHNKCQYDVLQEGFDWYKVRAQGKIQFVPKWVLDKNNEEDYIEEEEFSAVV